MKNIMKFLLIVIMFWGCKADKIGIEDVINDMRISNHTPLADGSAILDVTVRLNPNTDADKRNVVFRASNTGFLPAGDTISVQKAMFEGSELIAKVKYKVSNSVRTILFTAQPELRSRVGDYLLTDSVKTQISKPDGIILSPSASGVAPNYIGEVQVIATLKNGSKNASSNCPVLFEDVLANGMPAGGRYRQKRESSDSNSQASTYYAVGNLPVGTNILIKCTYLDALGNKTNITSSCAITTTQP